MQNDSVKYIAIVKEGHQYLFRYRQGEEPLILKAVLGYARNSQYNLDFKDVVQFMKRLRDTLMDELNELQA